ncbi:MAG: hypothetical protein IPJ40_17475 [Saprospirales bacterium]|nr:hypothetical protein [Saprospirales bacterium]
MEQCLAHPVHPFVYLVPYVEPKTFWPIALLGPTYPWLILLHLGFIAYWAVARKAYFLMSPHLPDPGME